MRQLAAWTLVAVMVAVCTVAALPYRRAALIVMVAEIAIFTLTCLVFWYSGYPKIAGATLSQDGVWIETKDPSPQFQAELDQARANYKS